ncbi:hypothetical protein [Nitrobacter sp. JJSN]|uniref:hypothetical protein n=1 Tax=Nitrobacter sp. JJSN TaxID=3453033 RepID=UPI003F76E622
MIIRVALAVVTIAATTATGVAGWNEDMAPLKGRVAIGTKGHLTQTARACPEPGTIRMVLAQKDPIRAGSAAAGWGCFDLSSGDKVAVEDGMPINDQPPSHICVKASPQQAKCVWMLNAGIKAN